MKEFDPDKPSIKIRGMGSVHYEQDGYKFNSGHKCMGKLDPKDPVAKPDVKKKPEKKVKKKADVRARARAKIGKKDEKLKDFRKQDAPNAVASAEKEDSAAKAAEENA